jgi:hypothetical protein
MGRVASRPSGRGDRPFVARPAARLGHAPMHQQSRVTHALEVDAHTVGMQREALGELVGGGRAAELAEQREEPTPRGLEQRVVVAVQVRKIDAGQFSTPW